MSNKRGQWSETGRGRPFRATCGNLSNRWKETNNQSILLKLGFSRKFDHVWSPCCKVRSIKLKSETHSLKVSIWRFGLLLPLLSEVKRTSLKSPPIHHPPSSKFPKSFNSVQNSNVPLICRRTINAWQPPFTIIGFHSQSSDSVTSLAEKGRNYHILPPLSLRGQFSTHLTYRSQIFWQEKRWKSAPGTPNRSKSFTIICHPLTFLNHDDIGLKFSEKSFCWGIFPWASHTLDISRNDPHWSAVWNSCNPFSATSALRSSLIVGFGFTTVFSFSYILLRKEYWSYLPINSAACLLLWPPLQLSRPFPLWDSLCFEALSLHWH